MPTGTAIALIFFGIAAIVFLVLLWAALGRRRQQRRDARDAKSTNP
ncbi:hypothetical protein ACXPWS_28730 [Mycobacterium sp. BMJ-28]